MKVLKIILGILCIIGSCFVMQMPITTGVTFCWVLSAFMLVFGIFSVIRFIEAKNAEKVAEKNGWPYFKTGIGSLILAIACIVLAIISRSSVEGQLVFIKVVSVICGLFIILTGIFNIVGGVTLKKIAAPGWLLKIILGVLIIIAGIYSIVNSFVTITAIGFGFGLSMMMTGITMIISD